MVKIKTKEYKEIRTKISYILNLISVLKSLETYHKTNFDDEFVDYLRNISLSLSEYYADMFDLMSDDEKEVLVAEPEDFGSYYSSKNTTSESHKYELLQEAYTQSFAIQEHFDKFQEFPNHLKDTPEKIYEFLSENEVYQTILEYMNHI